MHDLGCSLLTFSQDMQAQPPTAGDSPTAASPPGNGVLVAPGSPAGSAAGGNSSPLGGSGATPNQFFMILIVFVGLMLVFSMLGQRKDRKKREAMISAIKKHDRVQTIGGVIGSVVEVKPDYVVLKVDESSNTRITFARSAVQQVLTVSPETSPSAAANEKAA